MQKTKQLLEGKKVLITGGSVGIGLAIAEKCARSGAGVILTARTESDLKNALEKLKNNQSQDHCYSVLNVGNKTAVRQCAQWVKEKFGGLDGLVNCAGVYGSIGALNEINLAEFEEAIQINFLGTVFVCHYFAPLMKNRNAKIVNIAGGGASGPFPNYSAYATSKIAVVRLTENLAEEFRALGISVNAVAPGFVVTRLHHRTLEAGEKAGKSFLESTKKQIENGGVTPEKAANLTAFLLSDESGGINGKFISAAWDAWEKPEFIQKLKAQKNLATLRRIDGHTFSELGK